jgi:hypothetical protein
MVGFLEKWANLPPALTVAPKEPVNAAQPTQPNAERVLSATGSEREVPWAEIKAATLNRLFQEQGVTGKLGRITAATVRHGEGGRERVDSASNNEQSMSRAEATE